ncbi:MAG: glycine--tRNA ligase subunit beta [Rhodospirillaceae bacterium]|jgi:glycyl-tRNA synthetase beta chain
MPELLLELLSEEIPARMQARAADDLKRLVTDGLKEAGLTFDAANSYVTPRRLVLVVDGLPEKQPDVREEKRGPKADAPEKAIAGFKGSLPDGTPIEERETDKGTFLFAVVEKKGQDTSDVLADIVHKILGALPWQKSMRWGSYESRWVRPLQGIACVFAGNVIPVKYEGVKASNKTVGHRFLAPKEFAVEDFADYRAKLKKAYVILDPVERRTLIEKEAAKLAEKEGLTVKDDAGLLNEVTGLVEWPVVLMGSIDPEFMELPDELLSMAMAAHQKYFSTLDQDGKLAPKFIVVANMESKDKGKAIVAGNERVLRARLSDARFFWDQDRKSSLESRVPKLEQLVFHAKLGTVAEKVSRLQAIVAELAPSISDCDTAEAQQAALLCKADLVTDMVFEFPELQGVMGRYYALNEGVRPAVAMAVEEHYAPQGPNDDCPTAPVSVAVALADKIDTLVGFWGIDEKPTGSKDPYALRRAGLGVIRLIVENNLRLPLLKAFNQAASLYPNLKIDAANLLAFFADRLKVHLREKGVRHDLISAVFALDGDDDLVRLLARVDALQAFLETDDGANLLTAYKRARNIVEIEEKKDKAAYQEDAREDILQQDEEKALFNALIERGVEMKNAVKGEDFTAAMASLALLRAPVDAFFDHVTVNCDDQELRANRLRLLSKIRSAMEEIADFSQIEG